MIVTDFKQADLKGIRIPMDNKSIKMLCPKCSHTRRVKPEEPCLSITFNKTDAASGSQFHAFNCHNCGYCGSVFPGGAPSGQNRMEFARLKVVYKRPAINLEEFGLEKETVEFFKARGIIKETLVEAGVRSCETSFQGGNSEYATIFPFFKNGELINIQYRNLGEAKEKRYKMSPGAQTIYYGFDQIVLDGWVASKTLYVCEGLIDALTLRQCGYPFVWSVPNGSPFEEEGKPLRNPELSFHDDPDAQYVLSQVDKVVFVGDNDYQGQRLIKTLATRSGISKCWRVNYPEGCKDINEVLVNYGAQKVIEVIEGAQRFPVDGVVRIKQLKQEMKQLHTQGVDQGLTTGFTNLDKIFRVGSGRLITLTGVPESGKSRFLANLLHHMADLHGIKLSMFAPENRPFTNFTAKLLQIHTGKPFGQPGDEDRITEAEMDKGLDWLDQYFVYNDVSERSLEAITSLWEHQLKAEGTRYGVIDPFNYIIRPDNKDEGSFALASLTFLADWAVRNDFTIFVVVHPTKLLPNKSSGEYPVVTPYNIFGSSHWNNCSDFIISIWRSIQCVMPVEVHVLKAKQEELGTSNRHCLFEYDVKTGIYTPYIGRAREVLGEFENPNADPDEVTFYFDSSEDVESEVIINRREPGYSRHSA